MMKKTLYVILTLCLVGFWSCDKEDDSKYGEYLVAHPIIISRAEFKSSVDILPPRAINESGKIYAYQHYIFVNDKYEGVHIIDNSDTANPVKKGFINIPGNVDISVKDDYLYADSLYDLVVIDISDIDNIKQVNRLENVLGYNVIFPFEADIIDYAEVDHQNEIVVGWNLKTERRLVSEYERNFGIDILANAELDYANVGQGGSLARFKIVSNYLYAIDSHNINIFDIEDLENPVDLPDVYAGFDIETIFNRDNYLFLGSMRGMYIYDITNPGVPSLVSEFEHGTACDPVVVDGDYAFVTLRGGNGCGATESGLFIVDISDITDPVLKKQYAMDEPYGLGIKDEKLFVCDGASGLKVYDKTNVDDLISLNHFKDIVTFDVIPLSETLLMVGDGVLYQYRYANNSISLLSSLPLN